MRALLPYFIFNFLLLLPADYCTQSFDVVRLEALMDHIRMNERGYGTLSIYENGKEVFNESIGYRVLEDGTTTLNDKNTKYRVGSISKTYTAAIILQMIEEGCLTLDHTLKAFYPPFPNGEHVTIGMLLNHRSGLHDITADDEFKTGTERQWQRVELLDHFASKGYDHRPDSIYAYSNTNYILLSMISELVDGKPFGAVVRDRIRTPNNLISTYYGGSLDLDANEAKSFNWVGEWVPVNNTHYSIPLGSGGMVSSASELNGFLNALFKGDAVSQASLESLAPELGEYAIGMRRLQYKGRPYYTHTGRIDGYSAAYAYFPEEDISIALTLNAERYPIMNIFGTVIALCLNEDYDFPVFHSFEHTKEQLDSFCGRFKGKGGDIIKVKRNGRALLFFRGNQSPILTDAVNECTFSNERLDLVLKYNRKRNRFRSTHSGRSSKWKRQR